MEKFKLNLQLFAGTIVNATTAYVNSETGATTPFAGANSLSPGMKTFYQTKLLVNSREKHFFTQFGRKEPLPANHGRTIEFRKLNTLPMATELQEGVLPEATKFGETALVGALKQYGMYLAFSDLLDLHHVDPIFSGAVEELGASHGQTKDILCRNVLQTNTNVMFADTETEADGVVTYTTPTNYSGMKLDNNRLTPRMVHKVVTWLKKCNVPMIDGSYVAIIHPSVSFDLTEHKQWKDLHTYTDAVDQVFEGEIGKLFGVRFVETNNAKITEQTVGGSKGNVYSSVFLGKDAFATIDPEGGGMEMIIKSKQEIGGPLEQYSSAGFKFEDATIILYPERMVIVESCSEYSDVDEPN